MPTRKSWRCFHCNETFTNPKHAATHFGTDEAATPACKLTQSETHLIAYIRQLERDLTQYRHEDSHILRAIQAKEFEQQQALTQAEEHGYNKGVQEAKQQLKQEIETLRKALQKEYDNLCANINCSEIYEQFGPSCSHYQCHAAHRIRKTLNNTK